MVNEYHATSESERKLTDDETINRHIFTGYLQPTTRSSTQVDTASCGLEERVLFVKLDKLEGRTSSVALLSVVQHNKIILEACSCVKRQR